MIHLENLSKSFAGKSAVSDLNLKIARGEIFGFLGPNGAGKTTTIKMMLGVLKPTGGTIRINRIDMTKDRETGIAGIGYVPDTPSFHDFLTGREVLQFAGRMHGLNKGLIERISVLLEQFGLTNYGEKFTSAYSLGMRRKLALALAALHDPAVLLLDEPTNGLDPRAAREVKDWIAKESAAGKTIFLSTHLLDFAAEICSRIGVLHQGSLVAVGTPAEIAEDKGLETVFLELTR